MKQTSTDHKKAQLARSLLQTGYEGGPRTLCSCWVYNLSPQLSVYLLSQTTRVSLVVCALVCFLLLILLPFSFSQLILWTQNPKSNSEM